MADDDVRKRAYDILLSQGLSPVQAAAMVGHMIGESGGNPTAREGGGAGPGYGAFQWTTPSRQQGLQTFAKSGTGVELDPNDLETQLRYALREMDTTEKAAGAKLYGAKDYPTAVAAGMDYLRPAGWTPGSPTAGHNYAGRFNAGAQLAGVAPILGPTIAVAGSAQPPPPTGGLLDPRTAGDADLGGYGSPTAPQPAGFDSREGAGGMQGMAAGVSGLASAGKSLLEAGAPKARPQESLQPSMNRPKELAELPDFSGGFSQQLAQSRLKRPRKPWEVE